MEDAEERLREATQVIRDLLATISLDWYASQFCKTGKVPTSSGIAEKIHNTETLNRIKVSLERARLWLKAGEL